MTRMTYCTIMVWILAQISAGDVTCLAADAAKDTPSGKAKSALQIDDVYPVYGQCGSRRHTPFVAGERIFFAAKISGIDRTSNKDCNPGYTFALYYPPENRQSEQGAGDVFRNNYSLSLGGGETIVYFSFDTKMSMPKGWHRMHFQVGDAVTNQLAEKDYKFEVLEKNRICILNAGLYRDREFLHASGGNITLGERGFVKFDIRIPKTKNNEAIANASMTVFDRNNRAVWGPTSETVSNRNPGENGAQCCGGSFYDIRETGTYRVHIEAKDVSTKQIDQCDFPVVVHPLPGISPIATEPVTTNGNKNTLSIDAHPTCGPHGPPTDSIFMRGERIPFAVTSRGLARNADRKVDCTIEMYILAPDSSTCGKNPKADEMKGELFSDPCSITSSLYWRCGQYSAPGRYTVRFVAKDHIANKTASKDVPITITANEQFSFGYLRFVADEACEVPVGGNLTIGKPVIAACSLCLPKNTNLHDMETTISFFDRDRRQITGNTSPFSRNDIASHSSMTIPFCRHAFIPNRPGSYYIRMKFKDVVTKETVTKGMPFNVFLPPELPNGSGTTCPFRKPHRVEINGGGGEEGGYGGGVDSVAAACFHTSGRK